MFQKFMATIFALFFCLNAYALTPEQDSANEKVSIEVLSSSVPSTPDNNRVKCAMNLDIEAKVTAVEYSESGLIVGDIIIMGSYMYPYVSGAIPPYCGSPEAPKYMPTGWKGQAYLNSVPGQEILDLAAYADSFVKATATEDPKEEPVDAWDPSTAYSGGEIVSYNGKKWKAKYWTQGDEPGASSWGPWEQI